MLGEVQADSPALQAPSSCFCPPPSPPSPLQQSFQTFSPAVPPISREFQWKIVATSSILERHSLGLDHSDQPTTLSHSLLIIFLISWNSRCCVFVICCDGKPISQGIYRNRSNPKCVKLLRAQDPVIPELLPRWQVLAPMAPAQPRYAGAREGQQGQLRAITSLPCSPMNLNLASSSSCNCVPLSNNKQVRPHGMSRNARLSSLQTMSLSLMRTSIKFHTCYSSLSPRSIL